MRTRICGVSDQGNCEGNAGQIRPCQGKLKDTFQNC